MMAQLLDNRPQDLGKVRHSVGADRSSSLTVS